MESQSCINTLKHTQKLSNGVLLRIHINNNYYEQPIELIILQAETPSQLSR